MPERLSANGDVEQQKVEALDRIAGELQLIRETLDQIRSDVQWWTQNGSPQTAEPAPPVEKDPRLLPVYYPGDRVVFEDGANQAMATVTDVDDAYNTADIVVEPKGDLRTVSQDYFRPCNEESDSETTATEAKPAEMRSGQLF